jgi:hypothetical protein
MFAAAFQKAGSRYADVHVRVCRGWRGFETQGREWLGLCSALNSEQGCGEKGAVEADEKCGCENVLEKTLNAVEVKRKLRVYVLVC